MLMQLEIVWFWLLALMIATYVVLDGFDIGVGIVHLLVAKTGDEREESIRAVGPVWDANEVWLIAAGGTMLMVFPGLLATAFSGFYLPLMVVLWLLVARALAVELRHQAEDALWRELLDAGFFGASAVLAVVIGAALANVFRGVSLDESGRFFAPLWTDFRVGGEVGILDWFTILVGVAAACALAHHGALWLMVVSAGEVRVRAARVARWAAPATLVLTIVVLGAGAIVRPGGIGASDALVAAGVLSGVSIAALVGSWVWRVRGRAGLAFGASCAYLYATIGAGAATLFPYVLPARDPELGLTIAAAAAPDSSLRVALMWWLPGMGIVVGYMAFVYRGMVKGRG
jgi:cytochrome d ubiquinol oxidase subunit II